MTMSAIFAGHSPLIRPYPSAPPPPPAPPAPPTPPSPPQSQPITFSAITRSDVYAEIGSVLGSTTLATITCADSGMTIALSETVAGLTFNYTAGVLTVAGTPTGSTRVQRVVVAYISSDGNTTVRGSTIHTFTLVKAAETLTIGTIAGISGRVGTPISATVCTPTANFDADVRCFGATALGGVTAVWEWNRAGRTGTLTLTGTPTQSFNGGFSFAFSANGQTLGTGVSNCTIVQSYQAPAPAPAPTPSPPAPSPSPPPAPTPAPAPGLGADSYFSQTKVLLHFDAADSGLNSATSQPAFSAVACSQATNSGLGLMQRFGYDTATSAWSVTAAASSVMQAQVSGLDGSANDVSVECLVQPASVFWDAMFATSADETRFSPLVTYLNPQTGDVIWSLGIGSAVNNLGRYAVVTFVVPISGPQGYALGYSTTRASISRDFGYGSPGAYSNRLVHVAGSFGTRIANGDVSIGAWLDWTGGLYSQRMNAGGIKALTNGVVQIGGTVRQLDYVSWWRKSTTIIPFAGSMDEVRVTIGRYSSLVGYTTVSTIPADRRTLPWANY